MVLELGLSSVSLVSCFVWFCFYVIATETNTIYSGRNRIKSDFEVSERVEQDFADLENDKVVPSYFVNYSITVQYDIRKLLNPLGMSQLYHTLSINIHM